MIYAKVQTADFALAVAGAVLAGLVGWRPGLIPAWLALVPIGVLVLGTLALLPHQVLVAHEGWTSARQARFLNEEAQVFATRGAEPTSEGKE